MSIYTGTTARRPPRASIWAKLFATAAGGTVAALAAAPIAYMLWPLPAPVAIDAPALPISVNGVVFNVPPAAIRVKLQRRPGPQPRLDLAFAWPSLTPPEAVAKAASAARITDRLFVTIAGNDGTLPPIERLKVIYPRYAAGPVTTMDGLSVQGFRTGSPYDGEDLIHDPAVPARFILRCTRRAGAAGGTCLHERQIGAADITVRFPRDWLSDWRGLASGVDRLMVMLRPTGV
jgi:hypothetical protein